MISTCATYTHSYVNICAQYDFNKRDDASQSNINMICNHLSYHNYTGSINNTITHKQLITLPFITPFSSLELINVDKSTHHQISLFSNTYYKEIHEFHTLNKSLEIHLPQIVEQSLWDLSLPLSLNFQIKAINSNK